MIINEPMKDRQTVCISLNRSTVAILDKVCEKVGCSRSYLLKKVIESHQYEDLLKTGEENI